MTHNEREAEKDRKKVSRMNKNVKNYPHWLCMIREIGIDDGMTLQEVTDRFNIHTISDLFNEQVHPKKAYKQLTKMTKEDRAKGLLQSIVDAKQIVISIVEIFDIVHPGDVETSERLRLASKTLHFYQTEYKRLYEL